MFLSYQLSYEGYRYYLSLDDEFTRFTWIYPLTTKSEAQHVIIKFQAYSKRLFDKKIKCFQSNWGGEFRSLVPFFDHLGIQFSHLCPKMASLKESIGTLLK